jgi:hypothetical protein
MVINKFVHNKTILKLIILLATFGLGLISSFWLNLGHSSKYSLQSLSQHLETNGEEAFYVYVAQEINSPFGDHDLAHQVGEFLFKNFGNEGIQLCTPLYNWGCFHGFFGRSLINGGVESLNSAEDFCVSKKGNPLDFGGCVHGLGHGLMAIENYQFSGVESALKNCDLMERDVAISCYNGVFMEFNTNTMQSREVALGAREVNDEGLMFPCVKLKPTYQAACYYEQPNWWAVILDHNYFRISHLCNQLTDSLNRQMCFRGMGRSIPEALKFSETASVQACLNAPGLQERSWCLLEASKIFLTDNQQLTLTLCEQLDSQWALPCKIDLKAYEKEVSR